MKVLSTRQELAQYVNIKGVACVSINLDNITKDEWKYATGDDVRCGYPTTRYGEQRTRGHVYTEQGKWYISGSGDCLHNGTDINKQEALEMMRWSNAPTVREGDEIVVIGYSDEAKITVATVWTVGKINPFCMTACELH